MLNLNLSNKLCDFFFQYLRKGDQSINPRVKYTLIIPTQHAVGIPGLPVEFDWINENWSGCSKSCASGNYPNYPNFYVNHTVLLYSPVPGLRHKRKLTSG